MRKRKPQRVFVASQEWSVNHRDLNDEFGNCLFDKHEINIDTKTNAQKKGEILIHESLHANNHVSNRDWHETEKEEEAFCTRLAPQLFDLFHRNGWLSEKFYKLSGMTK